jgi:hypothetical protein
MNNQSDKAPHIAQAMLSELDHFLQNLKPSGGAVTKPQIYRKALRARHFLDQPKTAEMPWRNS